MKDRTTNILEMDAAITYEINHGITNEEEQEIEKEIEESELVNG